MTEREAFEMWWLDMQRDDPDDEFDLAFTAWQAACAWQQEENGRLREALRGLMHEVGHLVPDNARGVVEAQRAGTDTNTFAEAWRIADRALGETK